MSKGVRQASGAVGEHAILLIALLYIMVPIVLIALTAFKQPQDVYNPSLLFEPTLQNFRDIFSPPINMGGMVWNSIVISSVTVLITTPLAAMTAYGFSRYTFVGSNVLLVWVLATQFVPAVVLAIPFFNFFNQLGWIDTYVALIVVNLAISLPYSIWMIKGFVDALPVDMEESARTEGCGELQVLRFVTVPLIAPGVIVAAVFAFIVSWNEFLLAVIMTRQKVNTLTIGLLNAQGVQGVIWEQMAATGMIVMAPIFIMSFLIRKHFVQGLTMGAVK